MLFETIISILSTSKIKRKADEAEQAYMNSSKLGTFPEPNSEYEYFKLAGFMKWNLFNHADDRTTFINNHNKALSRFNQIGVDINHPPMAVYFYVNRFNMVYFYTRVDTFNRVFKSSVERRLKYLNV